MPPGILPEERFGCLRPIGLADVSERYLGWHSHRSKQIWK